MKDVGHCEKPRAAVNKRLSEDVRMGKPAAANPQHLLVEYIDWERGTRGTETSKYPEEKRSFPE
jgi:hypothetical protein